ncbi:MAG TPA: cohesin domain-containing protein [Acidobacteriaceae bacterium]|nr:cohesin domain-containing protein [Acidobacteriaceae bacterium]
MNLRMIRILSFAPALLLLAATSAFADGVVTLSPGAVGPGQRFTVAVNLTGPTVKGVPSGVSDVYAFQLSLSFSSSLIQARTVRAGNFLSSLGTPYFSGGAIDNGAGTVSNIFGTLVTVPNGASGSGTLATISFQGIAAGTPQITITKITLLDSHLNPIVIDDTPDQVTTRVTLTTAAMVKLNPRETETAHWILPAASTAPNATAETAASQNTTPAWVPRATPFLESRRAAGAANFPERYSSGRSV